MEFSRLRSANDTIAAGEPIAQPPREPVCATPEARQFDPLVGVWRGRAKEAEVTLRVSSTNRGCATLCFLDIARGDKLEQHFEAWAWHQQAKVWVARALAGERPALQVLVGTFDEHGVGAFPQTDRRGEILKSTRRVRYQRDGKTLRLSRDVSIDAGETWSNELSVVLTRAND